jgi:hypothetical protein
MPSFQQKPVDLPVLASKRILEFILILRIQAVAAFCKRYWMWEAYNSNS